MSQSCSNTSFCFKSPLRGFWRYFIQWFNPEHFDDPNGDGSVLLKADPGHTEAIIRGITESRPHETALNDVKRLKSTRLMQDSSSSFRKLERQESSMGPRRAAVSA